MEQLSYEICYKDLEKTITDIVHHFYILSMELEWSTQPVGMEEISLEKHVNIKKYFYPYEMIFYPQELIDRLENYIIKLSFLKKDIEKCSSLEKEKLTFLLKKEIEIVSMQHLGQELLYKIKDIIFHELGLDYFDPSGEITEMVKHTLQKVMS